MIIFFSNSVFSQTKSDLTLQTTSGVIYGTIQVPDNKSNMPLAIIVSDCKTDISFDQNLQNQAQKALADSLVKRGIATLQYDNRGFGKSTAAGRNGTNLTIENYVADLNAWINRFAKNPKFTKIVLVGHGQGALVAMICAKENKNVKKIASLEGAGQTRADVLYEQIQMQFQNQPQIKEVAEKYIEKLAKGEIIDEFVPQKLYSYFPPNLNRLFISWFKRNPQTEIATLTIPILIVQGTADAQIAENNATLLEKSNPNARKILIENMNHVFRTCSSTHQLSQYAANCKPDAPIKTELCSIVANFILE
ncbi:MAG: alpha/beta hydrolase [Paludibacter sp.]|nr:alpha/beta hydrolase [Paludibacter sp.]